MAKGKDKYEGIWDLNKIIDFGYDIQRKFAGKEVEKSIEEDAYEAFEMIGFSQPAGNILSGQADDNGRIFTVAETIAKNDLLAVGGTILGFPLNVIGAACNAKKASEKKYADNLVLETMVKRDENIPNTLETYVKEIGIQKDLEDLGLKPKEQTITEKQEPAKVIAGYDQGKPITVIAPQGSGVAYDGNIIDIIGKYQKDFKDLVDRSLKREENFAGYASTAEYHIGLEKVRMMGETLKSSYEKVRDVLSKYDDENLTKEVERYLSSLEKDLELTRAWNAEFLCRRKFMNFQNNSD